MKVSLTINGLNFGPYIAESGIQTSSILRNEKSIVTMDGVLHKTGIKKNKIQVSLLDMPDDEFHTLGTYLATNPATVSYTDLDSAETSSGQYYISDFSYTAKKAVGTLTVVTGGSFTLEEK